MKQPRGSTSLGKNPFRTSCTERQRASVTRWVPVQAEGRRGRLGTGSGNPASSEAGRRGGVGPQGSRLLAVPWRRHSVLWARGRPQETSGKQLWSKLGEAHGWEERGCDTSPTESDDGGPSTVATEGRSPCPIRGTVIRWKAGPGDWPVLLGHC